MIGRKFEWQFKYRDESKVNARSEDPLEMPNYGRKTQVCDRRVTDR
jgi:hypothetical protein